MNNFFNVIINDLSWAIVSVFTSFIFCEIKKPTYILSVHNSFLLNKKQKYILLSLVLN